MTDDLNMVLFALFLFLIVIAVEIYYFREYMMQKYEGRLRDNLEQVPREIRIWMSQSIKHDIIVLLHLAIIFTLFNKLYDDLISVPLAVIFGHVFMAFTIVALDRI